MEAELISLQGATDFTAISLFIQAGLVVKLVMILLLIGSIVSWAIIIQKSLRFRSVNKQTAKFENNFWHGRLSIEEFYDKIKRNPTGSSERIFCVAMEEWDQSQNKNEGVIIRVDRSMNAAVNTEVHHLSRGLEFLATVGSTAPFIGLFGTVWGIMNVFQEIGIHENTNLALIAPGIGEALAATALGLFAAIPAVIFYNSLSTKANNIATRFEEFADQFSSIVSREVDQLEASRT
ncbi:MAG: protein TolQ [Rhodobacteraceae bacterium]|nr:protein TolQ [Paracoccaceae bacterium]